MFCLNKSRLLYRNHDWPYPRCISPSAILKNQYIKNKALIRFLVAPLLALADSHSENRPVIAGRYHRVLSPNLRRPFVPAPKLYRLAFATPSHLTHPPYPPDKPSFAPHPTPPL